MKKLIVSLFTGVLLLIMIPAQAKDAAKRTATSSISATNIESLEVSALVARVNEINAMDKSSLTASERKEIRMELRSVKKEVNRRGGDVVYISGGLLVLIIVLIIIL